MNNPEQHRGQYAQSRFITRESGGNEQVLEALVDREVALDELVEQGGSRADGEYHDRYRNFEEIAWRRKHDAGIKEPQPYIL